MRKLLLVSLLAAGLAAFLIPGQLRAQSTLARPTVSPYVNLLRSGTPPGINYYGLVRPQTEFRSDIGRLQRAVAAPPAAVEGEAPSGLPTTGHPTAFLNHSHPYFGSSATSGTPSRRTAAATAAPTRLAATPSRSATASSARR